MKLYTEETVREILLHHVEFDHLYPDPDEILEDYPPIELPSDEEIEKQNPFVWGSHIFGTRDLLIWEQGAIWMRNKIQGGNK